MKYPKTLDIVVPMAGRGSRFAKAGFSLPKPLIDVNGRPMIQNVIENLRPELPHRFIFLVLEEHRKEFGLDEKLTTWAGDDTVIVPVSGVTEGAACTVMLAEQHLTGTSDMVIANSDQLVDMDLTAFVAWSRLEGCDGSIVVFQDNDPKWSFAKCNAAGEVTEVAEKKPISNLATVGIYYFSSGTAFTKGAKQMIAKDVRVNGEFYVCPVYNELIQSRNRILTWEIPKSGMHGIGTPEDLATFLRKIG